MLLFLKSSLQLSGPFVMFSHNFVLQYPMIWFPCGITLLSHIIFYYVHWENLLLSLARLGRNFPFVLISFYFLLLILHFLLGAQLQSNLRGEPHKNYPFLQLQLSTYYVPGAGAHSVPDHMESVHPGICQALWGWAA